MTAGTVNLKGPNGEVHKLRVKVEYDDGEVRLECNYRGGTAGITANAVVARWTGFYEPPSPGFEGSLDIGGGECVIEISELRGIGLGSLLMSAFVDFAHERPDVDLDPILLSGEHARTMEDRDRRNRFWEKLGFEFDYKDDGIWGESKPMRSHQLKRWDGRLKTGWTFTSRAAPSKRAAGKRK